MRRGSLASSGGSVGDENVIPRELNPTLNADVDPTKVNSGPDCPQFCSKYANLASARLRLATVEAVSVAVMPQWCSLGIAKPATDVAKRSGMSAPMVVR